MGGAPKFFKKSVTNYSLKWNIVILESIIISHAIVIHTSALVNYDFLLEECVGFGFIVIVIGGLIVVSFLDVRMYSK